MAELRGRQSSITFSGISSPTLGHMVQDSFSEEIDEVTRFLDVAKRKIGTISDGQFVVDCWVDSATTPALTALLAGTEAVLTHNILSTTNKYTVTNCILRRMEIVAKATDGSPAVKCRYYLEQTATGAAGTQPAVAT